MSRFISRALTSGMIGSSSPDKMSVRWRSSGRNGTLVQPAAAASWYRYPRDTPTRLSPCIAATISSESILASPP